MADVIIKGMKMPEQCIVNDNYCGTCPLDRTWCMQRYAPDGYTMMQAFQDRNGKLPDWCPLRPAPKWIPVTERLPKIDMSYPHHEDYLVQYDSGNMDVASWSNVNRFWTDHVTEPHWNCVQFAEVIAWMPLPEPPKEETP